MADRWVLRVDRSRDAAGNVVLRVRGEMDLLSTRVLTDAVARAKRPGHTLVLDLRGTTFIDSTGLHALLTTARSAGAEGWTLEILPDLHPEVLAVMQLTDSVDALPWAVG